MTRNLNQRVEVGVPIYDAAIKQQILTTLDIQWHDNVKARIIDKDQSNHYVKRGNKRSIRSQQEIYDYFAVLQQSIQAGTWPIGLARTPAQIPQNANYMAAVDLGSNSFHMVIARVVDGALQLLHREKQKVQLAEGLTEDFCWPKKLCCVVWLFLLRFANTLEPVYRANGCGSLPPTP